MYIVALETTNPIVANSPKEAAEIFIKKMRGEIEPTMTLDVWDTNDGSYTKVVINDSGTEKRLKEDLHLDVEQKTRLVEEMMYQAHCDDSVLRQICEMATSHITDIDSYNDWVGDSN